MDILYLLSAISLILFMVLATFDGFYLHLFKYELFNHEESIFEHKTHTIRALLFPVILWLLFIKEDPMSLFLGVIFVVIDLVVLALDAYSEKDSRTFMGGLPQWEYIIHLFSNSFHFAAIILVLATKISFNDGVFKINALMASTDGAVLVNFIAVNIIPGAVLLALVHILVLFRPGRNSWNTLRRRIVCC